MEQFQRAYKDLNKEQAAAVDKTDGPVLVIAGPGTGKTQLLSLRVANILKTTDSLPENIICLTFTNKAATNMQLRLSRLVGSGAQKVMIKTFHSFAAEIMSLYPDYFWNGARLSNVPDALQLEIITDILSRLPLDNPLALKFAGKYTATNDVQEGLKLTKEAGLTPDKLRALIQHNIEYIEAVEPELVDICSERLSYKKLDEIAMRLEALPMQTTDSLTRPLVALSTVIVESFETAHTADEGSNKTKNTSAWKARWVKSIEGIKGMYEERKRNAWWLALADVYELYRQSLHERGYYDYSDMIIEVITQLENNPDMLADIQERFHYVLIDEFQDTNAAQLRLAHLVADHPASEGNPNIMAVGDDDQSIYKFNGAELSNILGFTRTYNGAQVYVLTDNYRSSQAILDFSAQIIGQATERVTTKQATISKKLVSKNPPDTEGTIEHISYPTKQHEHLGMVEEIVRYRRDQPGNIAVLARSHESLRAMAHALHAQGVPIRYEQQQSILEQPLIKQLSCICEIITALNTGDEATVNTYMRQLLAGEAWGIAPLELWQLALKNRRDPQWIDSMLDSKNNQLATIGRWLLWLANEALDQPLPRILEYALGLSASEHLTSPLRRHYLEADAIDTPYVAGLSAMQKLISLAQEFSAHGQASTADFVRLLHVNRDNERPITDESLFVTDADAVALLTIHKAKGLEFDTVFIADAMESIWKPSFAGRKPPSNLPLRPSGDTYDDFIRLMFVAVTRAKRNIILGSYYTNDVGEMALPSAIIRDILPTREIKYATGAAPIAVLETSLKWPRLEGSKEQELLKDILEGYTLTPSGLLDFLDVVKGGPHFFLEKHLLRLPEALSTPAAFGNAIHNALEAAQQRVIDGKFELGSILAIFETALKSQGLHTTEFDRYITHGQGVLTRLFTTYSLSLKPHDRPEVKLLTHIGSVPLSGTLDHTSVENGELVITDYKTGKPLSSLYSKSTTLAIKAWRHRRQLEIYALMAQTSGQYKQAGNILTQMMYVEAESPKELIRSYVPDPDTLSRVERLVTIAHEKITSLNLPDTQHYAQDASGIQKFEDDLLNGEI